MAARPRTCDEAEPLRVVDIGDHLARAAQDGGIPVRTKSPTGPARRARSIDPPCEIDRPTGPGRRRLCIGLRRPTGTTPARSVEPGEVGGHIPEAAPLLDVVRLRTRLDLVPADSPHPTSLSRSPSNARRGWWRCRTRAPCAVHRCGTRVTP